MEISGTMAVKKWLNHGVDSDEQASAGEFMQFWKELSPEERAEHSKVAVAELSKAEGTAYELKS